MAEAGRAEMAPTFVTLGPEGTCHHEATLEHIRQQGEKLEDAEVELVHDLFRPSNLIGALERVLAEPNHFLVQCSAHPNVHIATEWRPREIFVVDTFAHPNKPLALFIRPEVTAPQSLALVSATRGYTNLDAWEKIIELPSNPEVGQALQEDRVDAGITFAELSDGSLEDCRITEDYGEVDTTWLVYGTRQRFHGEWEGTPIPDYYLGS